MNTWERHGNGLRPDAPSSSLWHLRPSELVPVEESNTSRNAASTKKKSENVGPQSGQEYQAGGSLAFQGSIPQVMNIITQHSQNALKKSNPSVVSRAQSQINYSSHIGSRDSDQLERSTSSTGSAQPDRSQKILKPVHSVNDQEGHGKFHFARTRSSPELTETSAEILSRVRRSSRVLETGKAQNSHARTDYISRRKNTISEVSGSHGARPSLDDPSSLRHSSYHQSLETCTDTSSVSNNYHDDSSFATMGEEIPSVSEALELQQDMQQEEQDLVNMMASRLHNFNGQFQLPMHLASPHLPLPVSPVLASIGYGQRNLAGIVPSNISFVEPSWGSGMQFPQGFVPSPRSPYYPTATNLSANPEEMVESGNEISWTAEVNPEDSDHGIWHEHDSGSSRGFDSDNGTVQVLHSDDKQHLPAGGFNNVVPLSRGSSSSASFTRGQQKVTEHRGQVRENHAEAFPYQTSRGNDIHSHDKNLNLRYLPVSQASSSRSKSSSESLRDGSSVRVYKSARDKWGRKPLSSTVMSNSFGRAQSGWQFEGSPGHVSPQEDEDSRDWVPLSTMSTDMVDINPGSAYRSHQPGLEPAQQISGTDSMIPITPMIVGNSRPRAENSGVAPFAFYPTGPPVPFLTMLPVPVYNFQSDGNLDGPSSHFDKDEGVDDSRINASDQNFDLAENLNQSEVHMSLATPNSTAPELSEEPKSDILHSDFDSHWKNLQFGRLCQTNHNHAPFFYPSPIIVPPGYLQGHVPWEGPGRPASANLNFFTQIMNYGSRLVPVAPLQSGPNRPSGMFQRYGDEAPRFRGGTGTYLPNPKVPFRDRQFPSTRNHRGNYNYDRNDHGDREGSWISAKARAAGRSHGRSQAEKPSTRLDRLGPADKRSDRQWDSYTHEPLAPHQTQNSSFGASNSSRGSGNMPYGMYSMRNESSNGVGPSGPGVPSVVMLYPYDQGIDYGSSSESLEFGSLGPVQLSSVNEVLRPSEGNLGRRVHEQRHGTYRGSSPRSSPDQPSSPHTQRGL